MKKNFIIAKFLKQNRKRAKLTQVQLSKLSGVGIRFVKELESGKPTVRVDKVNQVLKLFNHVLAPISVKNINRDPK